MAEEHFQIAMAHYDQGKFIDAATQFRKILEKDPRNYDALVGLGNCEREIGNELYTNATLAVQRRGATPAELKQAQAEADRAHERHSHARQCFEAALAVRPESVQALYGLGQLYLNRASGGYRLFTENEQKDVEAHFKAAVLSFEKVVRVEPTSYGARLRLGLALLGSGRRAEAKPHLEAYLGRLREMENETVALKPRNEEEQAIVDQQLIRIRKDAADTQAMIEECGQPTSPSSLDPLRALALGLVDQDRHAEALPHLERALARAKELLVEWNDWTPADERGRKAKAAALKGLREQIGDLQGAIEAARAGK